jgi:subtilisin family serine protease
MKKPKTRKTPPSDAGVALEPSELPSGPTGRKLVVFQEESQKTLLKCLEDTCGISAASTADFEDSVPDAETIASAEGLVFEHLGIAVIDADDSQIAALENAILDAGNPVLAIEDEEYVQAFSDEGMLTPAGQNYLRGYLDAVHALSETLLGAGSGGAADIEALAQQYADTAALTWGLQAVLADRSQCDGRGIKLAVLDTGMDLEHPDFVGRTPLAKSFVPGEAPQDEHGHGTHCIGTACGPLQPATGVRRYGVAHGATILAGKVLSNAGSGQDGWILDGMNWAVEQGAAIISMSLGSRVTPGTRFKTAYETAAVRAMNAGSLIIAAAGNSGNQPPFHLVGSPANCPSIMAVGALNSQLQKASFSCVGAPQNGSELDIAAPGVAVFSSVQMPQRHASFNGTSMATPHVAGCAALWAQHTGLRGKALWNKVIDTARAIGLPREHAGAGLVQAPSCRRVAHPLPPRRPPFWPFPPLRPVPFPFEA